MTKKPPKKSVVQEWLEVGLAKKGKTNTGLSKALGIPQPRVSEMKKGERDLKVVELKPTAEYLEAPIPPELLPDGMAMTTIPVVSLISAGKISAIGDIDENKGQIVLAGMDPRGVWMALIVEGDSMDRISPPGSIIVVDLKDKRLADNGLYVIADEEGNGTYKRYRINPPRFEPVSTNSKHEPIFPDREVKVVGRVRKSIYDM